MRDPVEDAYEDDFSEEERQIARRARHEARVRSKAPPKPRRDEKGANGGG
jgi:hypothetical protein